MIIMKKNYNTPEFEIICTSAQDIMTGSDTFTDVGELFDDGANMFDASAFID